VQNTRCSTVPWGSRWRANGWAAFVSVARVLGGGRRVRPPRRCSASDLLVSSRWTRTRPFTRSTFLICLDIGVQFDVQILQLTASRQSFQKFSEGPPCWRLRGVPYGRHPLYRKNRNSCALSSSSSLSLVSLPAPRGCLRPNASPCRAKHRQQQRQRRPHADSDARTIGSAHCEERVRRPWEQCCRRLLFSQRTDGRTLENHPCPPSSARRRRRRWW
jgi:hypothetical protein